MQMAKFGAKTKWLGYPGFFLCEDQSLSLRWGKTIYEHLKQYKIKVINTYKLIKTKNESYIMTPW